MAVNWNILAQVPNPGEAFTNAFQQAQDRKRQNALLQQQMEERAEDRALRREQLDMERSKGLLDQHRDRIVMGARIMRAFNVRDEASYQQARAYAQSMGLDVSDVPPNFDPAYVQNIVRIADEFEPQKSDQGRIITPQPGGGAGVLGPDGSFRWVVQPNDGSHPTGAPVGNRPPIGSVIPDPRKAGGPAATPPATFP